MKKILLLVVAVAALSACREETPTEKAERKLHNAAEDVKDAARDLKK